MSHPVKPFMPSVFVPVSDLRRSIDWYCELLDSPVLPSHEGGGIYYFGVGGLGLILDSNIWGFPSTIMFDSDDVDAAWEFCQSHPHSFMTELFRYPAVSFFNIDGNMICQSNDPKTLEQRSPEFALEHARLSHPLLKRISRVIVHADQLSVSEGWYETFLNQKPEPDAWIDGLQSFRMSHGADLLIDDNRLCQTEKVHFDRLHLDLRVNPMAIIETPNLLAALKHVQGKNPINCSGIETRLGLSFFTFFDPDGNGLMVCQSK